MHKLLLLGAGKIGRMIAKLLAESGDYDLLVADSRKSALARLRRQTDVPTTTVDAAKPSELAALMQGRDTVVSALSFKFNSTVAETALEAGVSYFDLTEDRQTAARIHDIARRARSGQVFMPQCGLAPGFISIVAKHLTKFFDELEAVHMRVGALPQFPTNELRYNLTWSTDGLINEYCNPCEAILDGQRADLLPLEGLESFLLDGLQYEAFNTSGGVGTLCDSLDGRVRELNYKTIRYPGHHALMKFLVEGLRLGRRRSVLKDVLEHAVPVTFQDLVVVLCTVTGRRKGQLVQISDVRRIYAGRLFDEAWSAIQISTGAGLCAALDLVVQGRLPREPFLRQEQIELDDFLGNRFGRYYVAEPTDTPLSAYDQFGAS